MTKPEPDPSDQLERFIGEVVAAEVVWGIHMTNGFANWGSPETEPWSVMPFWSTEEEAAQLAGEFPAGMPASIPLFDFLYRWLPNMIEDCFLPGVNCTADRVGPVLRASALQTFIHGRLADAGRLAEYQDRLRQEMQGPDA